MRSEPGSGVLLPWTSAPSEKRRVAAAAGAPPSRGLECSVGQDHGALRMRGQSNEAWNCGSSAERPLPGPPDADLRRPAETGHRAAVTATATPNQQPNCQDRRAPATPGAAGSRGEGGRAFGSARAREPPLGPLSPSRLQEAGEDARLSQSAEFWGNCHTATDNSRSPGSLFFLLCVTAAAGKRGRLRAETDLCVSTGQRCSRGF